MAKFDFEVAVAFGTQDAEGSYNDALDAITTSLTANETPGADSQPAGLILGDPEAGVRETGLSLTLGRSKKDKAFVGSSFTRSLSDFLKAEVRTFTFAFPFCGNRADASGPPIAADATPFPAMDALLEGSGLVGVTDAQPGWKYTFGSPNPISALIYYFGNRLELLDCRCALSILFEPGSIPVATATIEVGSIKDHSLPGYGVPATLTYDVAGVTAQQAVSAPVIQAVANTWREARGFSTAILGITPTFADIPDSNATTGVVKEQENREVTFEGTLFADDTTDEGHEYEQMTASDIATLDPLSFQVGDDMSGTDAVKAFEITIPDPEPDEVTIANLGTKAAHDVKLIARGATANSEFELLFR
jgi:hypothetical protein